jgi:hypothetical protein
MSKPLRKRLPRELNVKIILELPYREAKKKCVFFNLCEDENLWKQYVKYNYFIDRKSDNLLWFQVAAMANDILEAMFEKRIYPTFRALPFLFKYCIKDDGNVNKIIDYIIRYIYPNGFAGIRSWSGIYNFDIIAFSIEIVENLLPEVPLPAKMEDTITIKNPRNPPSRITQIYTDFERKCASYITEKVMKSTRYLTPRGIEEVEFDIDANRALALPIINKYSPPMQDFLENLHDPLYTYSAMLYLKQFG